MNYFIVISFLFYSLNITGFKIKRFVLVTSCIKDEPIDFVFWIPYVASVITFLLIPGIGQWLLLGLFVFFHLICFLSTYKYWIWPSEKKISEYNKHFSHTHHIIKPRDKVLIPDTFHISVFLLMFVNLVVMIIYILK